MEQFDEVTFNFTFTLIDQTKPLIIPFIFCNLSYSFFFLISLILKQQYLKIMKEQIIIQPFFIFACTFTLYLKNLLIVKMFFIFTY